MFALFSGIMADEMTLSTAPTSKRFPTTNQAKACYMYYNSWHQCKYDYSDEEPQCAKLKGWAMSMCPIEWVRALAVKLFFARTQSHVSSVAHPPTPCPVARRWRTGRSSASRGRIRGPSLERRRAATTTNGGARRHPAACIVGGLALTIICWSIYVARRQAAVRRGSAGPRAFAAAALILSSSPCARLRTLA